MRMAFRQLLNISTLLFFMLWTTVCIALETKTNEAKVKMDLSHVKEINFSAILQASANKNLSKKINEKMSEHQKIQSLTNIKMKKGGADAGGGGDAEAQPAEEYPDRELLAKALQLTYKKIEESNAPNVFKTLLQQELLSLAEENKFKYIPSLFFLQKKEATNPYHNQSSEFGSLGAMTTFVRGGVIYLSSKTLNYSLERLGELLLHECIHHILSPALTIDDNLVSKIANSVFRSSLEQELSEKLSELTTYQIFNKKICQLSDPVSAEKLIHLLLDIVSPYDLAKYESTNSFAKIETYSLGSLEVIFTNQLWSSINFALDACNESEISKNNRSQVHQVADIMKLIMAKMYHQSQVTFIWNNTDDEIKKTGIVSRSVTINVE